MQDTLGPDLGVRGAGILASERGSNKRQASENASAPRARLLRLQKLYGYLTNEKTRALQELSAALEPEAAVPRPQLFFRIEGEPCAWMLEFTAGTRQVYFAYQRVAQEAQLEEAGFDMEYDDMEAHYIKLCKRAARGHNWKKEPLVEETPLQVMQEAAWLLGRPSWMRF